MDDIDMPCLLLLAKQQTKDLGAQRTTEVCALLQQAVPYRVVTATRAAL